ncbi:MAG: M20/M25/M40 family metallo-hydrolase [Acidobacteriota bacterium]
MRLAPQLLWLLLLDPTVAFAASSPALEDEILALARVPSVVGREDAAADFVRQRLDGLDVRQDAAGNLVLTLGTGEPRRLFSAPLDEPGYVVSRVEDDGYLRLTPVPDSARGALAHQSLEGHKVTVSTAHHGEVYGAVVVPSIHLSAFRGDRLGDAPPFDWRGAYVNVGADSPEDVRALGIRLLDPVVLERRPVRLAGDRLAAPSIQGKAAAIALADAGRRLAATGVDGTVVLAWTVLGRLNGKGLEAVVHSHGPFEDAHLFSHNFGFEAEGRAMKPVPMPEPGHGALRDRPHRAVPGTVWAPHLARFRFPATGGPRWGDAQVSYLGLPTRYQDSPVELIHSADVRRLAEAWVALAGGDVERPAPPAPPLPGDRRSAEAQPDPTHSELPHGPLAAALAGLIERYGVSGAEGPVRERVIEMLPSWAEPVTDAKGNLTVTFGQGDEHLVFVAHLDEIGYRVREVRDDGRLELEHRGGMFDWLWEGQAALVHTADGSVPGVFEPRADAHGATRRASEEPLTVYLGVDTRDAATALGVEAGVTTVSMPKQMARLGTHRAVARSFDDRAGTLALLLAAARIDPAALTRRITLAWSVEEEVGLLGAKVLAERFQDADVVYPVDTFVSSDAPLEHDGNAHCPLGEGAVIRVLESINFAPRSRVDAVYAVAEAEGIPVQLGVTWGGTDGQPFLAYGIPSVPLSWPGLHSHSPIEILDFRDLEALVGLVVAIVRDDP